MSVFKAKWMRNSQFLIEWFCAPCIVIEQLSLVNLNVCHLSQGKNLNILEHSICQAYCFWNSLAVCHRMSKDVLWCKYLNYLGEMSDFFLLVAGIKLRASWFSFILVQDKNLYLPIIFLVWFIICVWSKAPLRIK